MSKALRCSLDGCEAKANTEHIVWKVRVCGNHRRSLRPEADFTHEVSRAPVDQTRRDAGMVVGSGQKPRRTDKWADWRTTEGGGYPEVVVTNPVKFCAGCGKGIERRFDHCRDCFHQLPDEQQREAYKRNAQAKHRRRGPRKGSLDSVDAAIVARKQGRRGASES